jgi:hypothetical protein
MPFTGGSFPTLIHRKHEREAICGRLFGPTLHHSSFSRGKYGSILRNCSRVSVKLGRTHLSKISPVVLPGATQQFPCFHGSHHAT